MTPPPRHLVIVGGGTAGWMAACTLQKAWGTDCSITLVESPRIPTVGVGEGSTPLLQQFFAGLGIAESEWMPACDATYKAGILFDRWTGDENFRSYFHPFFSALDLQPAEQFFTNCNARRRGRACDTQPDHYFVSASVTAQGRAPVPRQTLAHPVDYGYHFDAGKLAAFLRGFAIGRGLEHVLDDVIGVEQGETGEIAALQLAECGRLAADFFVDCTGFQSLLMEKTLGVPFVSFGENLFNDAAVAIATPVDEAAPLQPQTRSTALSNGWAWQIPLQSRRGNGYVYSSSHISAEEAERELRRHCGAADSVPARHLKMRVGRLQHHWHRNCLAVGLSQGFIEPLEATALMLVQFTVEQFVRDFSRGAQESYNAALNSMIEGIRDYIVAHYLLNTRGDSEYWRACREDARPSENLRALLCAWDGTGDFDAALHAQRQQQVYLRPSWYCILAGMGRFPQASVAKAGDQSRHSALDYCRRAATELFLDHREQLARLPG
ncbi:tryptophan halogenase family protein [Microbulbifer hainanensis]|uniref:tryptophan halogenase family protein n=1 Tax=Microbulbifer hainanensis TaxID=2735675 RepID=UPI001866D9C0|nr:tryptophan halogenase family protein [Microbulbifer hainanensis]